MHDTLFPYLAVSSALLCLGIYGLLCRKNLVAVLISLELILNSANINFVAFGRFCLPDPVTGQVFALFVIALAAAEVCIGLSLILLLYRQKGSIDAERANDLKG